MKSPMGLDANLPVTDLVKEAVGIVNSRRDVLMRRFLPLLLALTLLDSVVKLAFADAPMSGLPLSILSLLLSVVVATAAHRMTLCPQEDMFQDGYLGRTQWRYLGRTMLIGISAAAVALPGFMVGAVFMNDEAMMAVGTVVSVATVMMVIYISSRLMVTLPEIAIGRQTDFRRAWQLSKGNGSRLAIVVWVVPMVLMLPAFLLMWVGSPVFIVLGSFLSYIATLVGLVTLSLSYQFLISFDGDDQDSAGLNHRSSNAGGFDA